MSYIYSKILEKEVWSHDIICSGVAGFLFVRVIALGTAAYDKEIRLTVTTMVVVVVVVKSIRLVLTERQNFFFFTPHGSSATRPSCTASQRTLRNWYVRRYIVSRDNPPPYGGIGIELLRKNAARARVHFAVVASEWSRVVYLSEFKINNDFL